jgi:CRP/FNR family transcriptional regulator, cyclic AMP receptor protein
MTIIERVLLLQGIEFFKEVTTEQLSFIAAIGQEVEVPPGTVLYRENDPADGLYVVISGAVVAKLGEEVIERIAASESFGVGAFFDDAPRLTAAVVIEPSRLLFVSRDDFYDVLTDHVEIVQNILKQLVQRLRRLTVAVQY